MLAHSILVDAGLVGEGVGADDGLVGLHRETGDRRHQARCLDDVLGLDGGGIGHDVVPRAQRHHHLFHGRVSGPFA